MSYPGTSHFKIDKINIGNSSTNYRFNIDSSTDYLSGYFNLLAHRINYDTSKTPADLQTDSNTVCYLKFLEGTGTSINDQTSNNNDGNIPTAGFSWNGSGAYSGDSSFLNLTVTNNGRVEIADNSTLDFTNKMTIRILFKFNSINTDNTIIGKWTNVTSTASWNLSFNNTTKRFSFQIASPTGSQYRVFYVDYTNIQSSTWYLLQVSADLSGTEENIEFVINGINLITKENHSYTTSALTSFINSAQPVIINALGGSPISFYSNISVGRLALDNTNRSITYAQKDAENLGFISQNDNINNSNDNTFTSLNFSATNDSDNSLRAIVSGKNLDYKAFIGTFNSDPLLFTSSSVPRWEIDSTGLHTFYTPFIINKIFHGATPSGTGAYTGSRYQALINNSLADSDYSSLDFKVRNANASWIWDYQGSYQGNLRLRMSTGIATSIEPFIAEPDKNITLGTWKITDNNGYIKPLISDTYDIGTTTNRIRTLYGSTEMYSSSGKWFHVAGDESVSFGLQAYNSATSSTYNVAIGYQALFSQTNLNQGYNIAIGNKALYSQNVVNGLNSAVGYRAMYGYTNGINNVGVGSGALEFGTGAGSNNNAAIGYYSLRNASATGGGLVGIGSYSGTGNTSGNQNTYIGYKSGDGDIRSITGSRNILVGAGTHIGNATYNDSYAFGKDIVTSASTQAVFGGSGYTFLFSNRWEIDSSGNLLPQYPTISGTPDTTSNLEAYYQFQNDVLDSSGNSRTATLLGSANVSSNYLNIGNDATSRLRVPETVLNSKSAWTISAWLDIDTAHTTGSGFNATINNTILTGFTTGVSSPLTITYFANSSFERVWRITFFNKNYYFGTHTPANLTAFHFALIKNGTALILYENGIELGRQEITDIQFAFSANGLVIGQRQTSLDGGYSSTSSWAGKVDELRFYSRALSDIDIKTLSQSLGTIGVSISDPSYNIGGTSNRVNNIYSDNLNLSGTYIATGLQSFNGIAKFGNGVKLKTTVPGAYPYTALTTDMVIRVDTTSARTINLFTTSGNSDAIICIKDSNGSAGTNAITVDANGTQTIDGSLTDTINTNYGYQWYYSNGTNWEKIKGF